MQFLKNYPKYKNFVISKHLDKSFKKLKLISNIKDCYYLVLGFGLLLPSLFTSAYLVKLLPIEPGFILLGLLFITVIAFIFLYSSALRKIDEKFIKFDDKKNVIEKDIASRIQDKHEEILPYFIEAQEILNQDIHVTKDELRTQQNMKNHIDDILRDYALEKNNLNTVEKIGAVHCYLEKLVGKVNHLDKSQYKILEEYKKKLTEEPTEEKYEKFL